MKKRRRFKVLQINLYYYKIQYKNKIYKNRILMNLSKINLINRLIKYQIQMKRKIKNMIILPYNKNYKNKIYNFN